MTLWYGFLKLLPDSKQISRVVFSLIGNERRISSEKERLSERFRFMKCIILLSTPEFGGFLRSSRYSIDQREVLTRKYSLLENHTGPAACGQFLFSPQELYGRPAFCLELPLVIAIGKRSG